MSDLGRAAGKAYYADRMTNRRTGTYGIEPLPDDVSEELGQINRQVHQLERLGARSVPARLIEEAHTAIAARVREIYLSNG
jgi:hypothetical protein